MKALGLTRIRAGKYRHRSGKFIIQTEWDGPQGGNLRRWEIAEEDDHGAGLVINSLTLFRTLRAAAIDLESDSVVVDPDA